MTQNAAEDKQEQTPQKYGVIQPAPFKEPVSMPSKSRVTSSKPNHHANKKAAVRGTDRRLRSKRGARVVENNAPPKGNIMLDTFDTTPVAPVAQFPALSANLYFQETENKDINDLESDFINFARYGGGICPPPGSDPESRAFWLADGQTPEEIDADTKTYRTARREYIERMKAYIAAVEQDDKQPV